MSLSVMTMYAYVISQRNFKHCRFLTWFLFFTMLFGVWSRLHPERTLPAYQQYSMDIPAAIPGKCLLYNHLAHLYKNYHSGHPLEPHIDGAGHFRIFISIVLPLFKTGIATVGLFSLVSRWNDWFIGMLYIENPKLVPLQTLLTKLQDSINYLKQNAAIAGTPDGIALLRTLPQESLRMACTVAVILPILFAYPFFQRYFVQGLTVGSIKG